MIYPDSTIRTIIDAITVILLLTISLYVPFVLSFDINHYMIINQLEFLIDVWFVGEIFVNFITGFYDRGLLVMNRKIISLNYIKTWFFIDVACSVPTSVFDIMYFYQIERIGG